jgi:hypothetical protein
MLTKSDFLQQIDLNINDYPDVAPLYKAKDPRILQMIGSMATMLSMFSQQLEVAMAEPFDLTRDTSVLAAAAMRGIIRKATPGRVKLLAKNDNLVAATIAAGRVLLDSDSNLYVVTSPGVIPAATLISEVLTSGQGFIEADQYYSQLITHTAASTEDFYAIPIPDSDDGYTLSSITVTDVDDNPFEYRKNYINALPDNEIYTVEFDDKGVAYVRFGMLDVAGVQIQSGDVIKINLTRSVGKIGPKVDSPFSFDSLTTGEAGVDLSLVRLSLSELLSAGENAISMAKLRVLTKYPAIYDDSAVFLGEFEFLVRKKYPDLNFLSVWNEAIEEAARGGDLDNINTLFVACFDTTETVLSQPDPEAPVSPTEVTSLTAKQISIKDLILAADNSYKVKFYTPVTSEITIVVTARISTAHNVSAVSATIKQTLLTEFGQSSGNHASKPIQRLSYELLREKVPEINVGYAFLNVAVTDLSGSFRPELWRYATSDSITVIVTQTNIFSQGWGS